MPVTTVIRLGTDEKYVYSLPPEKAVVAAYLQIEKWNFNTWDYNYQHPLLRKGKYGWHCGDFSAPFDKESDNA